MTSNQKLSILVIEDNEQMSEMVKDYLMQKFSNAEITVFNTGEEALEATQEEPRIILLDYQLDSKNPGALNGLQILMKLKKKFNSPVICLSAQDKPEVSASIIKYGAYDYVVKNQQAFQKIENSINGILQNEKPKKSGGSQKTLITVLVIIVILLAAVVVWMKMS